MVVFDTNMLIALVAEDTEADDRARLDGLIKQLVEAKTYVGIPTPALAEFMVDAEQATSDIYTTLRRRNAVRILPFDERAAVEAAIIARAVRQQRGRRGRGSKTAQQVKIDRQIVAIAKAAGADALYSDDDALRREAQSFGVPAYALTDIPLPAEARQRPLVFSPPEPAPEI